MAPIPWVYTPAVGFVLLVCVSLHVVNFFIFATCAILLYARRSFHPIRKRAVPVIIMANTLAAIYNIGYAVFIAIDTLGTAALQQSYPCRYLMSPLFVIPFEFASSYVLRSARIYFHFVCQQWISEARQLNPKKNWSAFRSWLWRQRTLFSTKTLASTYLAFIVVWNTALLVLPAVVNKEYWMEPLPICMFHSDTGGALASAITAIHWGSSIGVMSVCLFSVLIAKALWRFEADNFGMKKELVAMAASAFLTIITVIGVSFIPYFPAKWALQRLISATGWFFAGLFNLRPIIMSFRLRPKSNEGHFKTAENFSNFLKTEFGYNCVLRFMQEEFAGEVVVFVRDVNDFKGLWPPETILWDHTPHDHKLRIIQSTSDLVQEYLGLDPITEINFSHEFFSNAHSTMVQLGFMTESPELRRVNFDIRPRQSHIASKKAVGPVDMQPALPVNLSNEQALVLQQVWDDMYSDAIMMMFARASAMLQTNITELVSVGNIHSEAVPAQLASPSACASAVVQVIFTDSASAAKGQSKAVPANSAHPSPAQSAPAEVISCPIQAETSARASASDSIFITELVSVECTCLACYQAKGCLSCPIQAETSARASASDSIFLTELVSVGKIQSEADLRVHVPRLLLSHVRFKQRPLHLRAIGTSQRFSQLPPSHRPHCRIDKVTPGHCTPRHNRWCHIHSVIEPDWSDNSAAHRTFICDYDPFEPPFDVFDSWNSYADFVNTDATLSSDICSHADTSNTDV
eukprot:g29732.t1